jgi:hypothetical protein
MSETQFKILEERWTEALARANHRMELVGIYAEERPQHNHLARLPKPSNYQFDILRCLTFARDRFYYMIRLVPRGSVKPVTEPLSDHLATICRFVREPCSI